MINSKNQMITILIVLCTIGVLIKKKKLLYYSVKKSSYFTSYKLISCLFFVYFFLRINLMQLSFSYYYIN